MHSTERKKKVTLLIVEVEMFENFILNMLTESKGKHDTSCMSFDKTILTYTQHLVNVTRIEI